MLAHQLIELVHVKGRQVLQPHLVPLVPLARLVRREMRQPSRVARQGWHVFFVRHIVVLVAPRPLQPGLGRGRQRL